MDVASSNKMFYIFSIVEWQNVHQEVENDCHQNMVWVPFQEKFHNKRCLLDPEIDDRVHLGKSK